MLNVFFVFSEADFEDFLNNLYNGKPGGTSTNGDQSAFRCDNRRRKTKRKKWAVKTNPGGWNV